MTAHQPSLARRADLRGALAGFDPSWFTPVMGTGILAVAASSLPVTLPALHALAWLAWSLAASLLAIVLACGIAQLALHRQVALGHHLSPTAAHGYGAPAMAFMTVGAGALLLGQSAWGARVSVGIDAALWSVGTLVGLIAAVAIPYLTFTRQEHAPDAALGSWLMPVVAPMVSASTGALIVAHLAPGQARQTLMIACYAMVGAALVASLLIIAQVWTRLTHQRFPTGALVPTFWIVLGPLGQSVTAFNLLGAQARGSFDPATAAALEGAGVVFGVPVLGFAMMWLAIAALMTRRAARASMPFTLSWWSFTFPVGTCVTGAAALAAHTGNHALEALSVALFGLLLGAWAVTAPRTAASARAALLA